MNEKFVYGTRSWYPHLKPADIAIWEEFIKQNPTAYEWAIYDQAVGTIPNFVKEHPDAAMQKEAKLYQWKIDIVAFVNDKVHVIEIKPNAGLSALGQILGYTNLFKETFPKIKNVSPLIITDFLRPDMSKLAADMGIEIYSTNLLKVG